MEAYFTNWARWREREALSAHLEMPGVYAIAISQEDISGQKFTWLKGIAYIGLTISQGGLRSRLKQFDRTIRGREGHGGGCRMRFTHRDYGTLIDKLYVAVRSFNCADIDKVSPWNLRIKGEVVREEFECLARYAETHGNTLPEFNNPEAPKLTAKALANARNDTSGSIR